MIKLRRVILSYICGGSVILGITAASLASAASKHSESRGSPIYNAETNSYFQMFEYHTSLPWLKISRQAMRKRYKGERGRLAIVKDPKTLDFIREKFSDHWDRFNSRQFEVWIGLRFFCKYRTLMWVDGAVQSPKAPGMWHSSWYRNNRINCYTSRANKYMPIYLTATDDGRVFWQASGSQKAFSHYLVEFPAPKKSEDVSQNLKEMTEPAEASTTQ